MIVEDPTEKHIIVMWVASINMIIIIIIYY